MTTPARLPRLRDRLIRLLVLALLVGGGYMVYDGYAHATFEPAPMPSAEFSTDNPSPAPFDLSAPAENRNMPLVAPTAMARSTLMIPALGVYAPLVDEQSANGRMTLPVDLGQVGIHLKTAPLAAETGSMNRPGVSGDFLL